MVNITCNKTITLWKLLLETGLAKAGGDSNRLILQNMVRVNTTIVVDPYMEFETGEILSLQVGNNNFMDVKLINGENYE